ncbi:Holliday junction DNA helicase RuvA [Candidatus Desantisbacteria bacterium CG2_30_40_21]|uniref:Putative pre-16S rRNA nuclease n=5 Tax=unclassified Candidatus Desantisiibacteriota TaxID=3106372 RepID=A0A2M7J849_9BACT|nr:MAG: Holliday junction DNA helicase RuvA [Candidatus Desantisbacteria bacterium CG2_30_40_21]PIP42521.1 MAG: Holliday junction resolvase RuvX [Candidatus Desantisbacteria bacterium CG23_combo_of_CG06-09_8_20_14_all_40_23]PIX15510.1 MAG: Holliday junction resolvase RuvX [Candidatus Desantisbacteria bacterium CG_4_8_14_3_um_filter_40_12]PIY19700.1 MAG: Holliday junction resolvase RuvX [Candidatus Desantisbacteria bacterium CG_4_10_14_3_um_filter_40_18]PJB29158.1 MAG: Holliday junction resolvas
MRIMGLDVGDKYIGVALSDPLGMFAQPLSVITREGEKETMEILKEIISTSQVSKIVFGLPKNMNGSIGPQAEKVLNFIERLKQAVISTPSLSYERNVVEFVSWDERLSSRAAENAMLEAGLSRDKRKKMVDKIAAALILQGYLDSRVTFSN